MEEKIVNIALDNLMTNSGIRALFAPSLKNGLDGEIHFMFQENREIFSVQIKREIRQHQITQIIKLAQNNSNFMVLAETIFPKIKDELRKHQIGYLDIAGNIYIQTNTHMIWIEGRKQDKINSEKTNRAFKSAGLKVIYLLLTDDQAVNASQRITAEQAGMALGNVNYVLNELKLSGYILELNKKHFQLNNKKELLQKWMSSYEDKLKPSLHIGNFKFLNFENETNWRKLNLEPHQSFWGGEPAGALITKYLEPSVFTIYTEETRNDLIRKYQLVPDPNGKIKIYKKFWKDLEGYSHNVVHSILAYTDLVNSGNSRCIETAHLIYDQYIQENI
jgi:hypothetical protein